MEQLFLQAHSQAVTGIFIDGVAHTGKRPDYRKVDKKPFPNDMKPQSKKKPSTILSMEPYTYLLDSPIALDRMRNKIIKRSFDIVFSFVFLCTIFPFIFVIVFIVTECTMPGNIFFVQKRTGLGGKTFNCYKFRTMRQNADSENLQATRHDKRVTRWGRILRKTNLDETPQFFNVLLGNMSVVGPRPHMLKHTDIYSNLIDGYMARHLIKPGITGWSQINGFRGEIKELSDIENRIRYDIWYIEHWYFSLDLYIIVKTFLKCFGNDNKAY